MKKTLSNPRVIVALLCLAPAYCFAQSSIDDRFSVSLGAFVTDRDTDTRLDSNTLRKGTTINLEEDLALDTSNSVFKLDNHYRFDDRRRVNSSVFDLLRDSSKVIQRDIQFGENFFSLDTVINATSDLTIYKLAYTYSFMRRYDGYLGVTAGT